jgi:CHAT domain-containing protein
MSETEKKSFRMKNEAFFNNFTYLAIERAGKSPSVVVPLAEQSGTILGELYNFSLASKGWLLNNSKKIRQQIMASKNAELIAKYDQWEVIKNKVAHAANMALEERISNNINLEQLQSFSNELEKEISLKSEAFNLSLKTPLVTWKNIREKLKAGEAAIEILRTNYYKKDTLYLALIITSQTKDYPDMVVLSNGRQLETRYFNFYKNAIKNEQLDSYSYNQFWKPITEKLGGITKAFVSADGVYHQLSLNTLLNPETKKYLGEEIDIQQVTSTRDILSFKRTISNKHIGTAVIIGNPAYTLAQQTTATINHEASSQSRSLSQFANMNVPPLPGTQVEVNRILGILDKQHWKTVVFTKETATEENAKTVNNPNLLHIATHGFFIQDPQDSGEPMLRSGLVLAGAVSYFKSENKPLGEDGILSAYEVTSLNLDSTEMIVLSACETGLGDVAAGEGVYGLQRALKVAGAKSILISMWSVSDLATQELMSLFYENWITTGNKREALRAAQQSLRVKYPAPFYWGAFVMVGE